MDSKDILRRVIEGKTFSLKDQNCISSLPAVPDSLTLSEVLDLFKTQRSDFAVVLNEYALTVGVIERHYEHRHGRIRSDAGRGPDCSAF